MFYRFTFCGLFLAKVLLISHLSLLVAVPRKTVEDPPPELDILIEAAKRIDDPIFTELVIQIIKERNS